MENKLDVLINDNWEVWSIEEVHENINFSIKPDLKKANEIRINNDWIEIIYNINGSNPYSEIYNSVFGTYVLQ